MKNYTDEELMKVATWLKWDIDSNPNWKEDLLSPKGRVDIEDRFIYRGCWIERSGSSFVIKETFNAGTMFSPEPCEVALCYGETPTEAWINLVFKQIEYEKLEEEYREKDRIFMEKHGEDIKRARKVVENKYNNHVSNLEKSIAEIKGIKR